MCVFTCKRICIYAFADACDTESTKRTNGDGGDLGVDVQHAVPVHIHQVVPATLVIVAEEMDRPNILQKHTDNKHSGISVIKTFYV